MFVLYLVLANCVHQFICSSGKCSSSSTYFYYFNQRPKIIHELEGHLKFQGHFHSFTMTYILVLVHQKFRVQILYTEYLHVLKLKNSLYNLFVHSTKQHYNMLTFSYNVRGEILIFYVFPKRYKVILFIKQICCMDAKARLENFPG